MRRGEICSLNWGHVDFSCDMILIPPHPKRTRCVSFMTPQLKGYLIQYKKIRELSGELIDENSPLIIGE